MSSEKDTGKDHSEQPERSELLKRRKETEAKRLQQRQNLRGPGGKRHRHDAASAHFRLRSGRKG
jgi:hypothetical protein